MLNQNAGVRALPPKSPGCVTLDKRFTSLSSDPLSIQQSCLPRWLWTWLRLLHMPSTMLGT